uniref:Poly(A) polymerase catalytic subunit domain-containing protein n=1 Tax=viral metagenome TaxID=1070528 RepID=A0A6C0I0Y0_9ZZZZ
MYESDKYDKSDKKYTKKNKIQHKFRQLPVKEFNHAHKKAVYSNHRKHNVSKFDSKFDTQICDDKMTFEDCELAILRHAIDETEEIQKKQVVISDEIRKMYTILEKFIISKKLIVYGGLALNRLMPKHARFYNEDVELPDYDMYSENALENAKELADIYFKEGYKDVEAKSGVHYGTFKVFVNFIAIADITQLQKEIYNSIKSEAVIISGIYYCPPNYLRMSMYLELSRPAGDISRWEKIYKRLTLLNKFYPLKTPKTCKTIEFQRDIESDSIKKKTTFLYYLVRDNFIEQEVIFFGGYANLLYSKYMPNNEKYKFNKKIPDFDVLAVDPDLSAMILTETLKERGFNNITQIKHEAIGEIIPEHIQILVEKDTIAFIYKPIACHSYNIIHIDNSNREARVATIDTMLNFYLAFLYVDLPYYSVDRILCMANYLFEIQQKNRLNQRGLLKRFSSDCIGKQPQLEDMRAEKAEMFKKLMDKRGSTEYEMWFLKYNPALSNGKMQKHSAVISMPKNSKKSKKVLTESIVEGSPIKKKRTRKKVKKLPKNKYNGIIEPVFNY